MQCAQKGSANRFAAVAAAVAVRTQTWAQAHARVHTHIRLSFRFACAHRRCRVPCPIHRMHNTTESDKVHSRMQPHIRHHTHTTIDIFTATATALSHRNPRTTMHHDAASTSSSSSHSRCACVSPCLCGHVPGIVFHIMRHH